MDNLNGSTINGAANSPQPLSPAVQGGSVGSKNWTLTVDNTTNAAMETVIGDFTTALAVAKNIAANSMPSSAVDGTFGQDSLAIYKLWTGSLPVAIQGVHVVASDEAFFAQGKISGLLANIENQSPTEAVLNFATDVSGETYNPKVRNKAAWRFLINGRTGIYLRVPAGMKVTVTFGLFAQADANLFLPV